MKNRSLILLFPITALTLTSCIFSFDFSSSSSIENTSSSSSEEFIDDDGHIKIDNVSLVSSDLKNIYAPSFGDVKMLVIPIAFVDAAKDEGASKYLDWTSEMLSDISDHYFGEENSLAAYYEIASLNQLHVSGKMTSIYENSTISSSSINGDGSFQLLFDMIENAIGWVQDNDLSINWSEYDLNRDGCVDNVHLITNYKATEWASQLWPHMYWTDRVGTLDRPLANVYSISATNFMNGPITSIHEQGHIFGLEDYYSYSEQDLGIDYVGGLDMQSHNVFDWNSFSKLSMGWVKPYVVTGERETTNIKIKAASINGDCILIPANYSTWNGSAFDEYFIMELFAPYGNNKNHWNNYSGVLGKDGGIRLYHVDARVFGTNKVLYGRPYIEDLKAQQINCAEDVAKWKYIVKGTNNSTIWTSGSGGIEQLADKHLLGIVQKGGTFTFAKEGERHTLDSRDLFKKR